MRYTTPLRSLIRSSNSLAYSSNPVRSLRGPSTRIQRYQSTLQPPSYTIDGITYPTDSNSNTPSTILSKLDRKLLQQPHHPLFILRQIIESHFADFTSVQPSTPIVTVAKNFDELGFAPDHPGRSLTDSYYLNKEFMLRTHTSAHEVETYQRDLNGWLLSADVYRRDEIDKSHYPVFHQMEGSAVWPQNDLSLLPDLNKQLAERLSECPLVIEDTTVISDSNPYQPTHDPIHAEQIAQHLKHSLNSLIFRLFGPIATKDGEPLRIRWIEAFFPFTTPSYEVEVWWNGEWLELLGCGVVMQKTLDQAGMSHKSGWAFGLGLERLAMVLFSIPDIRLFWSQDPRFLSQFSTGKISNFKPYSKYPPCYRDMSFWIPTSPPPTASTSTSTITTTTTASTLHPSAPSPEHTTSSLSPLSEWHENDYCEIVRDIAGDLVETVEKIDDFTHPKTGKKSKTYRLNYRSMDRSLSNEEVNVLQAQVQRRVVDEMGIEMR